MALGGAPTARARARLLSTGRVGVGLTDNVDLSPRSSDDPGARTAQGDGFTEIEPGLLLALGDARMAHQLGYHFLATLFFNESAVNSYAHRADWLSFFELGERQRLLLNANVSYGRQNTLTLLSAASAGIPAAYRSGRDQFLSFEAAQSWFVDFTAPWTLEQSLRASAFLPRDTPTQPRTVTAEAGLALTRSWDSFQLGARLAQEYTATLAYDAAAADPDQPAAEAPPQVPATHLMVTTLFATSAYAFDPDWRGELRLGVLRAAAADDASAQLFHPAAWAALRYAVNESEAELSVGHSVRQNLFLADTFLFEDARLRGRMPLAAVSAEAPSWLLEASVGYEHGQAVDLARGAIGSTRVELLLGDAALLWRMDTWMEWSLRYQFSYQSPIGGTLALPAISRHLALVSATFRYPPERTPTLQPRERLNPSDPAPWQSVLPGERPAPLPEGGAADPLDRRQ